jgi:hypothetical protein
LGIDEGRLHCQLPIGDFVTGDWRWRSLLTLDYWGLGIGELVLGEWQMVNRPSKSDNRQSPVQIANRQSTVRIDNRQSAIANRQSTIANAIVNQPSAIVSVALL